MPTNASDHASQATASNESAGEPTLPAWKAFVVQFSRETRPGGGVVAGRVEHISSGRRARFATPDELIAALATLLDELGEQQR
jgi:hypothetical protein